MKRQIIEHTATTAASPDAVFDRLIDPVSWPEWSGHREGLVVTPASSPGAVGEVREFRIGRKANVERVVASTRPRRFSYVLVKGLPLRDYRADVDIDPVAGGTRITWHSEFFGSRPLMGAIYRVGLSRFIGKLVANLAAHLDAQTAGSSRGSGDEVTRH